MKTRGVLYKQRFHARSAVAIVAAVLLQACEGATEASTTRAEEAYPAVSAKMEGAEAATTETFSEPLLVPVSVDIDHVLLQQWAAFAHLAGHYWVLNDAGTAQYLLYEWEDGGRALAFSGMDRDGNPIAGRYAIDPASSEIVGLTIYRGEAYELVVESQSDGFSTTTRIAGESVRTTFIASGSTSFRIVQEAYRRNEWQPTRTQSLLQATPRMIQTLGWRPRTPEIEAAEERARQELFQRRPSFFSRVANAFQDGAVAGVEEGAREGVSNATRRAITGDDEPDYGYSGSETGAAEPTNPEP